MAREKKGSIDGLKDKLYSRKEGALVDPEERTPLSTNDIRPPVGWKDPEPEPSPVKEPFTLAPRRKKSRLSLPVKFFIGSLVFFFIAAGAAAYLFFSGGNSISPQNIDLSVVMPSVIDGGKTSNLQILIDNRNQANLKLVDLVINYPTGTRDPASPTASLTHERQSIGAINAGQQLTRTAQAIFYGQEGQSQQISVQLQYSIAGSNAIFEKDASASFTVGSSPISISVGAPTEAIAGQQFSMDVTVQSNALTPIQDVVIQGQYPFGFTVTNSSPQATAGGTLWRLGTMQPGDSKVIHLSGTLDGQDGDTRVFYFLAGSDSDQTDTRIPVPFLSVPQTMTVRRAFISGQIAIGGQTGKTVSVPAGSGVQGVITWTNNLPDAVSDVQLSLSLKGPTIDGSSVTSSTGFYQSSNSTIVWSKDQNSELATVPPGGTGTLPFSFSTLPAGSSGTLYSNPAIDLNLTIQGTRQGQTGVPENVSSAASVQVLLSSVITLKAQALHFSGPFSNSGPMPPIPGQSTNYAIVWTVTNTSNTIANAVVSTTLPAYVTFVGASTGSGVVYDPKSRTVTWTMGDVKAGTGLNSPARTAAFQVSFLPSTSQTGQSPTLTGATSISGQDRFTQASITASADAPTIQLGNDAGYNANMGTVAPKQ